MSHEKRKVKSSVAFRSDQLVIVYDDLSPGSNDLRVLGKNKFANAEDDKQFTSLIDDFPRVINAIGRYRYSDQTNGQRDVELLPVPLSEWLALHRDQERPDAYNIPLLIAFVQFFYWRQTDPEDQLAATIFSSQSVTKIILQQVERVQAAHVHNVRPLDYDTTTDQVHISAVCLSRWGIPYVNEHGIWPRYNALVNKLKNMPAPGEDRYEFSLYFQTTHVHLSTTLALEDSAYRDTIVGEYLLHRIVGFALFDRTPVGIHRTHTWNTEAATLSAVVSHGLTAPDTAFGHALTGNHLYDPRLFLHIWYFLTGDTLPKPQHEDKLQRDDKRKKDDDNED